MVKNYQVVLRIVEGDAQSGTPTLDLPKALLSKAGQPLQLAGLPADKTTVIASEVKDCLAANVQGPICRVNFGSGDNDENGYCLLMEADHSVDTGQIEQGWISNFVVAHPAIESLSTHQSTVAVRLTPFGFEASCDVAFDLYEVDIHPNWSDETFTFYFHKDHPLNEDDVNLYKDSQSSISAPDGEIIPVLACLPFMGIFLAPSQKIAAIISRHPQAQNELSQVLNQGIAPADSVYSDALLGWGGILRRRILLGGLEAAVATVLLVGLFRYWAFNTPGVIYFGSLASNPIAAIALSIAVAYWPIWRGKRMACRMRITLKPLSKPILVTSLASAAGFFTAVGTTLIT